MNRTGRVLLSLAVALALRGPAAAAPAGAVLEAAVAVTPSPVAVGGTIEVVLAVTNTGDTQATGVAPFLDVNSGAGLLGAGTGPSPAGPVDIDPGLSQAFTWTYPVSGAGTLAFTATAVGTDAFYLVPVESAASASVVASPPAALASALALVVPVEAGQPIEVRLTATNTGDFWATGLVAAVDVNDGAGLLGAPTGPLPPGIPALGPGFAGVFVWTFPTTAPGVVSFTATATGTDAGLGGAIAGAASAVMSVQAPPSLSAAVAIGPSPVETGQWLTVSLTVTNDGGTDAAGVVPFLDVNAGGSLLELPSGPSPVGPLTLAAGGGSATFVWTFSVSGAGAVAFTATAAGLSALSGAPHVAAASAGSILLARAALAAAASVSPAAAEIGQSITVAFTVTNTGDIGVPSVTPAIQADAGSGLLSPVSSPSPAAVGPGASATFQWVYAVTGAGPVAFTVTGSGLDGLTARPVRAAASAALTTFTPTALAAALAASPAPGQTGDWITLTLTVTNTGGVVAFGVVPAGPVATAGGSLVSPAGGPVPAGPVAIPGGGVAAFVWTVSASGCGSIALNATAAGTDAFTGAPVSATGAAGFLLKGDPWDPTDDAAAGASLLAPVPSGVTHGPHALCAADTTDWYRLPLVEGRAYRLAALSGGGDSYAELFADVAATSMLAADDDSGGALQFAIEATAPATHDAWLRVRAVPAGGDWAGYVTAREMARTVVAVTPSPASVGQSVEVVLTVTNTGGTALNAVTPALAVTAGASALSPVSAPGALAVPAGASRSFTWVHIVTGAATVELTGSATGTEAGTGIPRTVFGRAVLTALAPSALVATAAGGPDPAAVGQWITLAFTVTNTGGTAVNGLAPSLQFNAVGALLVPQGGVVPAGPVVLAAGASRTFRWTYSVGGTGAVGYTVTGTGTDAGSGATVLVPASGSLAALWPAQLATAVCLSPALVEAGRTVKVVMTVTNTGGFAALGVTPALQRNAGAAVLSPVDGPEPAGAVTLAPGASQRFTWTYSVTGASALGVTGTATGADAASGGTVRGAGSATGAAISPAKLVSRLTAGPTLATTGQVLAVTLTVTNEGGSAATGVVAALAAADGSVRVAWAGGPVPAAALTILAGGATTFAWSWTATGAGPVTFSATAAGTDAGTSSSVATVAGAAVLVKGDAWDPGDDLASGGTILTPSPVWQTQGPHALGGSDADDWYRVALAGGRAYRFETPGGTGDDFGRLFADAAGTVSVASDDDGAGAFQFRLDTTAAATQEYYLRITTAPSGGDWNGYLRWRELLAASLAVSPAQPASGQWFDVVLTVTNTAGAALNAPALALGPDAGASLVVLKASPSAPASIASGATASFTWTYSVSGAGPVAFSGTITGTDAATGRGLTAWAASAVIGGSPAALSATIVVSPSAVETGMTVRTRLDVTNSGAFDATGVVPALDVNLGAAIATLAGGPTPAGPVTIPAGSTRSFTWTWSLAAPGTLAVTATASGTSGGTGAAVLVGRSVSLQVMDAPVLVSQLCVSPRAPVAGQAITVAFTVTNQGGANAVIAAPTLETTGSVFVASGPLPAGPAALAPGTSTTFVWTCTVTGTVSYVARATGQDGWTGAGLSTTASTSLTATGAAALTASVQVSYSPTVVGRLTYLYVTVRNVGASSATAVTVGASAVSGTAFVAFNPGVPASPIILDAGAQQTFVWTWTPTAKGSGIFSATATGSDAQSGLPLTVTASSPFSVVNPSSVVVAVAVEPSSVVEGDLFWVQAKLTNAGESYSYLGTSSLAFADSGMMQLVSGAYGGGVNYLAPGGTATVAWQVRALRHGVIPARVTVPTQDAATYALTSSSGEAPVTVTEKFSEPLAVWPNPATSSFTVAVRLEGPADEIAVEVYNSAFKRVGERVWRFVAPGADAQLPVWGVSDWAPGVYLVRAKVTYPGKRVVLLKPVKLAVKK
ncbi:MAG: hypothetical protein AAB152_17590 [Candidatus Coatesbacteria bacterium]